MNNRISLILVAAAATLSGVACERSTPTTTTPTGRPVTTAPSTAPDNTARNKVDRDTSTKTPVDQAENSTDIKTTAEIRRALMDDKSMSTDAQNCKIVTQGGVVTLRGVVSSQAEKDAVEAKAKAVAGVSRVDNQLEVKNP